MFDSLFNSVDEETIKILKEFFANDKNVSLKTELNNVIAVTILEVIQNYYKEYPITNKILSNFINTYKINMISHKRKSRKEFVEVLKNKEILEEKEQIVKKFLGVR